MLCPSLCYICTLPCQHYLPVHSFPALSEYKPSDFGSIILLLISHNLTGPIQLGFSWGSYKVTCLLQHVELQEWNTLVLHAVTVVGCNYETKSWILKPPMQTPIDNPQGSSLSSFGISPSKTMFSIMCVNVLPKITHFSCITKVCKNNGFLDDKTAIF